MMNIKQILLSCIILKAGAVSACFGSLTLHETLSIEAEIRGRYDYKNHGKTGSINNDFRGSQVDNTNDYFFLRSTVGLNFKPTPWFNTFVQIRDSRVYDHQSAKNNFDRAVDLYQAWITFGDFEKVPLKVKIGRQEVGFGSYLIVGIPNYNTGRSFDAARLTYKMNERITLELFGGRAVGQKVNSFNDETKHNEFLSGFSGEFKNLLPYFDAQVYLFSKNANTDAAGGARDIYSVGTYLKSAKGALGNWNVKGEFVYQFGRINSGGTRLDHQSFLINLGLGYTFKNIPWKPALNLEYYYSPGDKDANDGKSETFDLVYPGKNHPRAGVNDLVGWRNTQMVHLGLKATPHILKGLKVSLDYWAFWMADTNDLFYAQGKSTGRNSNGYGRNPGFANYLGSEISCSAKYKINKHAAVKLEYAHFFVGDYIKSSLANTGGAKDFDSFTATLGFKF